MNESMCDRLCGAFNPCIFNRHPYFCYRFFQKLYDLQFGCFVVKSCYYSLTLILVSMCSPGSSLLFSHFSSMSRIFFSMFMNLSQICLYLSSSSFFFTMVEFIPWSCVPTESVIVCRNVSIFQSAFPELFSFSSVFPDCVYLLSLVSSSFSLFCLFLLLFLMCLSYPFHPFLPAVSGHFDRSFGSNVVFFFCFLFIHHCSLVYKVRHASRFSNSKM